MSDLIDTTEMYLRTIYELVEEGITPLRARIAERLGQSGPTVSQTVARMERDGLLIVAGDRHLELTPRGRDRAINVMRKHRLAECLLIDVIGLEWQFVHDEACRWEHVMSDRVERRIYALLGKPSSSPYGNPIPGLAELGGDEIEPTAFLHGVRTLADAATQGFDGRVLTVARLAEPLQADVADLARFREVGLTPGSQVRVSPGSRGGVVVSQPDGNATLELDADEASLVYVSDQHHA